MRKKIDYTDLCRYDKAFQYVVHKADKKDHRGGGMQVRCDGGNKDGPAE